MELQLRISGLHHEVLRQHLLPPDGREAVAVALCGRFGDSEMQILLVHDVTLIPYDECFSREHDFLVWPTNRIRSYFEKLATGNYSLLKIHSHPGGYDRFSLTDDKSDHEFFSSVFGWTSDELPHVSAVMLPDTTIFGRFFYSDLHHEAIDCVSIAGNEIKNFRNYSGNVDHEFALRIIQAFGEKTYLKLSQSRVGVVGCSGTGSVVIEQLARFGIGEIVLIDPDLVEEKNINRILNATSNHAREKKSKVNVIADAIKRMGLGTYVEKFQSNLYEDISALRALVKCDMVFGCMDTVDGRHLLNQLCTFYLIPYFDVGVKLEASHDGGIEKICGSVHYLQPGKSSLITRGVYTMDDLRAASQYRKNPIEFESLRKDSYIKNVNVNNPAVISVNMQIASHAVNELLNRIHPFRSEEPKSYSASTIDLTENYIVSVSEEDFEVDGYLRRKLGMGDTLPFIEMPELSV